MRPKKRTRIREVNRRLRELGFSERLVGRRRYYYYFNGGNAAMWPESGVYGVCDAEDWSLDQWMDEFHRLSTAREA